MQILITGGSGSFGHAFVRRLLASEDIDRIVVYSRDEQKQETMARAFSVDDTGKRLRYFIGDVRDLDRLTFGMHGIDTVVHAAALKIVPAMEYNPTECIATNVTGAENVVKAAIRSGVKKAIALSTDKAVNPVNLYGATKLAMEKVFIAANYLSAGSTQFSVVRYGNVVGSRGSVIPLFKKLTAEGQVSLPITHPDMTRFWITLDQAIDLVFLCEQRMSGREIFVPKIPSMKIIDLARAFSDAPPHTVGIRPGEKINEVLITEDEARSTYDLDHYYMILPPGSPSRLIPVREGFRYTSDGNTQWLTVEQLKSLL